MQLNDKQLEAVQSPLNQNIKVLAGPGAGKTSGVIVPRYLYLVEQGISPDNILCVAFNKEMAAELLTKIKAKMPLLSEVAESQICTINAFCYRQLKLHWYGKGQHIRDVLPPWKSESLIQGIIDEVYGQKRKPTSKEALEFIARFKMAGLPELESGSFFMSKLGHLAYDFIKVYRRFEQKLKQNNQLTFSDQLYLIERLLIESEVFRTDLQTRIAHVLLDEAQDASGQALRILITISQEAGWNEVYKESE